MSGGGSLSMNTMTVIAFGGLLGMFADAFWYSLIPSTSRKVPGCGILTEGDLMQFGLAGGATFLGFMTGNKIAPALTFGVMIGMMIPKIVTPFLGLPRYILFDYNPESGAIKPVGRL